MFKPLEPGSTVSFKITERDGWALNLEFEVISSTDYSSNMKVKNAEIFYYEGHEQDQWPKVHVDYTRPGDPECEDCQRYNRNQNAEVPCRAHQK